MPISTESTVSALLKTADILGTDSKSDKTAVKLKVSRHSTNSAKRGKNSAAQAITPYIPTVVLSIPIEALTVVSASDRAVPAIGTEEPIINFAVLRERVSAEALTAVCILKIPKNTVVKRDIVQ